ncbi:MAG: hypothetical protein JEY79_01835 [Pseudodesulfovibrio sp.]|nr:hypothetical protein [Pseudodesulfovibrio sp.]
MDWDNDELEEVSTLQSFVGSQKGPGLFGIVARFHPYDDKYALCEQICEDGIAVWVVNILLLRGAIQEGSLINFNDAGTHTDTDGMARNYGVAVADASSWEAGGYKIIDVFNEKYQKLITLENMSRWKRFFKKLFE